MRAVRLWLIFRSSKGTGSVVGFEALSGSVNNISANAEMYGSVLTGYLVDQGAKVDASGLSIRIGVSEDGYVRGDKYVMDSYESRNCNNNLGFVNRGSMELKGTGSVYAFGLDNIGLLNEGTFVCSIGNQYNVKVMNFNAAGENNTALKNTGTIESDFVVEMYGKEIADKTYTNGNCKGIANSGIIRCDTMVIRSQTRSEENAYLEGEQKDVGVWNGPEGTIEVTNQLSVTQSNPCIIGFWNDNYLKTAKTEIDRHPHHGRRKPHAAERWEKV